MMGIMIHIRQLIGRYWPLRKPAESDYDWVVCSVCDGDGWHRDGLRVFRCSGPCYGSGLVREPQIARPRSADVEALGFEPVGYVVDELEVWRNRPATEGWGAEMIEEYAEGRSAGASNRDRPDSAPSVLPVDAWDWGYHDGYYWEVLMSRRG